MKFRINPKQVRKGNETLRTVKEDKWKRKECIATCDSDLMKDIIKTKLQMTELKENHAREREDMKCSICNRKKDNNRTFTRVSNGKNSL